MAVKSFHLKAILPQKKFDPKIFEKEFRRENEAIGKSMLHEFNSTISQWKGERPSFGLDMRLTSAEMRTIITIGGSAQGIRKWQWLNYGTKPHIITPKRAKRLRFRLGGSRKTVPGKLWSLPGKPPSGPEVFAKLVHHPGFPARKWDELIRKQFEGSYQRRMEAALSHAARASGYAYP